MVFEECAAACIVGGENRGVKIGQGYAMTEPTTVLWVRNSVAFGGVETTMLGWLDHMDQSRFRCPTALFKNRDGIERAYGDPVAAHGHEILDLPWWPGRQFRRAVDTLVRIIRETNAQLLHTHDWRSDVLGYYAAKRTGIPILTTVYVWFKRPLKIYVSEWIDARYIRHFDLVTVICDATRQQCVSRGVSAERTELLISGISSSRFRSEVDRNQIRSRFGIGEDDIAFVYVARFYPEKAHLVLMDAMKTVLEKQPRAKLLLLGKGPLEDQVWQYALRLGIADRVVIPGFVTDVADILLAMDVTVHASLAEGLPAGIYESMAAGLPIIGSNVDGTPEAVIPGETGWLVPPGDSKSLAAAMTEAAVRPDLCQQYGANGRELMLSHYNMDIAREKLEAVYDRLLTGRSNRAEPALATSVSQSEAV